MGVGQGLYRTLHADFRDVKEDEKQMSTEGSAAAGTPTAEELLSSLEQKGYACTDLGEVGDGRGLWRCETGVARPGRKGVMVLIWSAPGGSLQRAQASSYGYGEDPGGVFAYLAASVEGSDEARAWVERNFATADVDPVQRSAGGTDFMLEGGGKTRILSIDVPGA